MNSIGLDPIRRVHAIGKHAQPREICVHELFEQQAMRTPDAPAASFNRLSLTYRELNERANQLAHYLRRRGAGPDVLIGVSLPPSLEMLTALLGIWKAGAAYVPLDPSYPRERLSFMIRDAGIRALLTGADWPAIAGESRDNPQAGAAPSNLAYVIYTSGSTGEPKGAMIEHRGLANYLRWAIAAYGVGSGSSIPVHSSISFDLTVTSLYPPLLAGGYVELLESSQGAQSLWAAVERPKNYTLIKITPAHLDLLAQQVDPQQAAAITRAFVIGGENLKAESLRFWRKFAPATRLINEYGPTETVVGCCVYEVRPDDPDRGFVPIGQPIANTSLYILGPDRRPVPPGVTGELYIGGAGVGRGYLNRPDQAGFLPDPFSDQPGARLYKTGDLARLRRDGNFECLGRTDHQVKIRGYRVELGEIEQTLAAHPDVIGCVASARELSPGDTQALAYVIARPGSALSDEVLRAFLKGRLPAFMLPAQFIFSTAFPSRRTAR